MHIDQALRRGAIDFGASSISAAVRDADIVFLCTPVSSILELIPKVAASIKPSAIVTDVGSTKSTIVTAAKKYFHEKGIFVGGHPMAGSEGKGIEHADALLFQNATYVLCADRSQRKELFSLSSLLHSIGARVLFLSAQEHDSVAAAISHLPQLIAVGMMTLAGKKNEKNSAFLQLAAGGFRDITRIASSPYEMWRDILAGNAKEIRHSIKEFSRLLSQYEKDLRSIKSQSKFAQRFHEAKTLRDAIPRNSKGFLHSLFDVYVSVDDKPGVLAHLTTVLAKAKINIKDIELLKIQDGRGGSFRISFGSRREAEKAEWIMTKAKIKVI